MTDDLTLTLTWADRATLQRAVTALAVLADMWREIATTLGAIKGVTDASDAYARGTASGYNLAADALDYELQRLRDAMPRCRHATSILDPCAGCIDTTRPERTPRDR